MRAVLDTNTVVSALDFTRARVSALRTLWRSGRMRPVVSAAKAAELLRVLAYPKCSLGPGEHEALLADSLAPAELYTSMPRIDWLSVQEQDDRPCLDLAAAAGVDLLVAGVVHHDVRGRGEIGAGVMQRSEWRPCSLPSSSSI